MGQHQRIVADDHLDGDPLKTTQRTLSPSCNPHQRPWGDDVYDHHGLHGRRKDGLELSLSDDDALICTSRCPTPTRTRSKNAGNEAKRELPRDKLATLAYKFDPHSSTRDRYVMRRRPELDKGPR